MPDIDVMVSFTLATLVFGYMPGPALLYAAAQTIAGGKRAGWMAAMGLHVGGYLHVFAAAFGLALLFEAVPILYLVLKIVGACYLIWLGARLILSRAQVSEVQTAEVKSPRRAFWESATVEMLNPKTALFYLAFLPQFTDPAAGFPIWVQFLILGSVVNLVFSSADVICVLLADRVMRRMRRSPGAGQIARRTGGVILVGLGVNLAVNRG